MKPRTPRSAGLPTPTGQALRHLHTAAGLGDGGIDHGDTEAAAKMGTAASPTTSSLAPSPIDLERFYAEAMPIVYRYFLARCGADPGVAEDLTQDTMVSAAGEIRRGRFGDFPIPWVLGIARHRLLDHYGRRSRDRRHLDALARTSRTNQALAAATELTAERVHEALGAVPALQRAAVVLHHLDGLAVTEVARLIRRSPAATESLLARGRANLRAALEGGEVA